LLIAKQVMSLRFLQIGVSGLRVEGDALGVVGDNIANVNTPGFKRQRSVFEDVFNRGGTTFGGAGVRLGDIQQAFTQGTLVQTGMSTDLAITGDGFFALRGNVGGIDGEFYSRAGQFRLDANGRLVDPSGLQVLGNPANADGTIAAAVRPLTVPTAALPAAPSTQITLVANLDAGAPIPVNAFDPARPEQGSALVTSIPVYDSLGAQHEVTVYWRKVADNSWEYHALAAGDDLNPNQPGVNVEVGSGTLQFTTDGALSDFVGTPITVDYQSATSAQVIDVTMGTPINSGGSGLDGLTQFAMQSSVSSVAQDGYASGNLTGVSVDSNGMVLGQYTNGQSLPVGQLVVAKFASTTSLGRAGNGLWVATSESGGAVLGAAGSGGRGMISSGAIEQSNVDVAEEMVSMIQHQRAYGANSKVITTADDMLTALMQIKS
jgi:flagellar hook protein FlgE